MMEVGAPAVAGVKPDTAAMKSGSTPSGPPTETEGEWVSGCGTPQKRGREVPDTKLWLGEPAELV